MTRSQPEVLLKALSDLEKNMKAAPGLERRSFPRVPARGEGELLAIDQLRPKEPIPIQIREVGWGGCGFICQEPLEEKSRWLAILLHQGQQVAQQMLVVRYCSRVAGGLWLVGTQACVDNGVVTLLGLDHQQLDR